MATGSHLAQAAIGLILAASAGCARQPAHDPFAATGEVIAMSGADAGATRACFSCHGLRGEGDGETAPRLAGLPAGYLQKQLEDYAAGLRPDPLMRTVAGALSAQDRRKVAAYYAGLPTSSLATSSGAAPANGAAAMLYHRGDPERGLPACASCHGERGEGLGPANPPLAGQPAGYLREQLAQWRRSARRNDPRGLMLDISRRLTPGEAAALAEYGAALDAAAVRQSRSPATSR